MTLSIKHWVHRHADHDAAGAIALELGISSPVAQVMVNRGLTSVAAARAFISPSLEDLHNPFLLPDITPAVARIRRAVDTGEHILVYGDRDVDGVTALSIMVRTLRSLGATVSWYIPSDEGYGLHIPVIDAYVRDAVTLIVTVDCGISAALEIDHCTALGVDVVVTDHHEPPSTGMPRALAVIDPKRSDAMYPFKELAGCAVAFKVAEAVMLSYGRWFDKDLLFAVPRPDGSVELVHEHNGIAGASCSVSAGNQDHVRELLREAVLVLPPDAREQFEAAAGMPVPEGTPVVGDMQGDGLDALRLAFHAQVRQNDLRMKYFREGHLDAVALGTIADMVPLTGENRVLAKHGMHVLARSAKAGVRVLLERCLAKAKNSVEVTAKGISWSITPLINAAGRRGKAGLAAELMLTEDAHRAHELMDALETLNAERRELQAENMDKFLPLLEAQCDVQNDKIFVVAAPNMEHGVTGIIASQIARKYGRPTVLLIIKGAEAMGAARSIEGFDIVGALNQVSDILVKFGGHTQAAGLTVSVERIDELRARLVAIADREISSEQLHGSIDIDATLSAAEVSLALVKELAMLEPFGTGNPYPLFELRDVRIREQSRVGASGDHLKLKLSGQSGPLLSAIGWNMAGMAEDLLGDVPVALVAQLETNVWQDKQTVQLLIADIKNQGEVVYGKERRAG